MAKIPYPLCFAVMPHASEFRLKKSCAREHDVTFKLVQRMMIVSYIVAHNRASFIAHNFHDSLQAFFFRDGIELTRNELRKLV